jgi:hypothetical protein
VGTLIFTRSLKGEAYKQREIMKKGNTIFLWAYSDSKTTLAYHGGTKGSITFDIDSGGGGGEVSLPIPVLVALHAGFMLLSWG